MNGKTIGCAIAMALSLGVPAVAGEMSAMVYKSPWCGCCEAWVEAMRDAGYTIETTDLEDLALVKKQAGVPANMQACHTAVLGGDRTYIIEGHVPIAAVERLLERRPDIRGISVPGMPQGSLGMGDDANARYTVFAFQGSSDDAPEVFYEAGK